MLMFVMLVILGIFIYFVLQAVKQYEDAESEYTEPPTQFQQELHAIQKEVPDSLLDSYFEVEREAIFMYRKGFATKDQTLSKLREWLRSQHQ